MPEVITNNLDLWSSALRTKSTAGRGNNGKQEAYGIKKLRELIYELAGKGLLVDTPSGETDKTAKIGDIADLVMGQAPPGHDCNKDGVGTVFVKTGEFGDLYPEVVEWTTKPLKFAKEGDVLICVVGATVGKLNLAIDCAIGRSVAAIRPRGNVDTKYLYFSLMPYTLKLRDQSRGSAQGVIGKTELNAVDIRHPSMEEQHRIVAKVDELMALCDQLEQQQTHSLEAHQTLVETLLGTLTRVASQQELTEAWTRIATHFDTLFTTEHSIDQLKQTILQLAVMGKLTPQDPNDELDEKLLDAPKKAERNTPKWTGPIEEQEKPFQLPSSWMWLRLGDISSLKHGYAFSSAFFTSEPAPFVLTTPGNFYEKGGFRDRKSKRKYYSGPVDPEFVFKPGDLIIPMTEQAAGLLGSPAFIPDDGRVYIHNQRLGKLSFSEAIAPEFAFWFFNCEFFRGELSRTCTGMKVRHTSPDRVLKVPFPVCPLAEQRRIVAKVDELMTLCDALKERLADAQTIQLHLADAIVEQAVA